MSAEAACELPGEDIHAGAVDERDGEHGQCPRVSRMPEWRAVEQHRSARRPTAKPRGADREQQPAPYVLAGRLPAERAQRMLQERGACRGALGDKDGQAIEKEIERAPLRRR